MPSSHRGPRTRRRSCQPSSRDHARVWADLLTFTLYCYAANPAFTITFGNASARMMYRFVFERGDAQYMIRDGRGCTG